MSKLSRPDAVPGPPLVYVVDDDADMRETIIEILALSGVRAQGFGTGMSVQAALAGTRPDLVVVDQRLPDTTGIALAASLKSRHPDLGVILLTGYVSAALGQSGSPVADLLKDLGSGPGRSLAVSWTSDKDGNGEAVPAGQLARHRLVLYPAGSQRPRSAPMATHEAEVYANEVEMVQALPAVVEAQRKQIADFYKVPVEHLLVAHEHIQSLTNALNLWMSSNCLSLNASNTQFIRFCSPQQLLKVDYAQLT